MSDAENDEFFAVDNVCFICNHVFVDADEPWYIFNKQTTADKQLVFSISELLCKVLEKNIDEDTVHSRFLCEICNANLLEFDSLERRLIELKERIKQSYAESLNTFESIQKETNLTTNLIDFIEEDKQSDSPQNVDDSVLFKLENNHLYRCLCCQIETFPSVQQIVAHLRSAHKKRLHPCMLCEQTFVQKQHLNNHIEKTHVNSNEFAGFECEPCNLNFTDFPAFRQHQRSSKHIRTQNMLDTYTEERPYKCHKCGKGFAAKYTLQAHVKIHTERERPYQCEKCKKSFLNEKNLNNHLKSHLDNKPFICVVCGKAFKSQHNLDVHNIVHTKVRPYKCRTCDKSFARRSEIIDHDRTHTGERPFQCDLCPLAFAQRANLSSHKKSTHFNEKLHKCQHCERAFKRKRLLDYHIQAVHTGERPHKCNVCGMGFVYPEHYKKHLLIHTGLKPYACEVCGKQFKSRDNRNAHRFVHSDKKPYECLQCGAGFMRKPQLLQHMNNTAHATDTIIVNQPQINNSYLKLDAQEEPLIITKEGEEVEEERVMNVLTISPESVHVQDVDSFVGEHLENVKYLNFEDFDNDDQGTITWMNIGVKEE